MKGKLAIIKDELSRQMTRLSVTATILVHMIYLIYLAYALKNGVGSRPVNIVLMIATVVFLVVYLILRLVTKNKKRAKTTKKFYKRIKLVTKVFTTATALYTIFTASTASSPLATVLSMLGAAVLLLRIIFELIASLIARQAKKIKASFSHTKKGDTEEKVLPQSEDKEVENCFISDDI